MKISSMHVCNKHFAQVVPHILWCFGFLYIAQIMLLLTYSQYIHYMVDPVLPAHVINICWIWHVHQNSFNYPLYPCLIRKQFVLYVQVANLFLPIYFLEWGGNLSISTIIPTIILACLSLQWLLSYLSSQYTRHLWTSLTHDLYRLTTKFTQTSYSKTKALRQVALASILKENHRRMNHDRRIVNIMPYPMHLIRRIYSLTITTKADFNESSLMTAFTYYLWLSVTSQQWIHLFHMYPMDTSDVKILSMC